MKFLIAAALLATATAHSTAHADETKSRTVGQALAGVGTGVSSGLILASLFFPPFNEVANKPLLIAGLATSVFTPSLGHYYAHDYLTIGMATRLVAGAMIAYGAFEMTSSKRCLQDGHEAMCSGLTQQGIVVIGLGAIAYIGGVAYDINDTGDAVDAYNRKHGVFMTPSIGMARGTDDRAVPTVGLSGSF
jgi:hypothetical protein